MTDAATPEQPRIDHSTHEHTRRGTCTLRAATPAQPRHYYSTRELIWHMAECISPQRAQEIADAIEAQARPAVASEGLLRATLEATDMRVLVRALYTSGLTDDMNPVERRKAALRLRDAMQVQAAALASDAGSVGALDVERLARAVLSEFPHLDLSGRDMPAAWAAIAAAYAAGEGEQ